MSFKNPDLSGTRPSVIKARYDYHTLMFLHTINSEATAKREIKNLTTLRDQCRDLGQREAADCFDTALEAVEEGMEHLGGEET